MFTYVLTYQCHRIIAFCNQGTCFVYQKIYRSQSAGSDILTHICQMVPIGGCFKLGIRDNGGIGQARLDMLSGRF